MRRGPAPWILPQGSRRQFKHPVKPGRATIAGAFSDDLSPGTLNSIMKQAQLRGGASHGVPRGD
ncbi:MAG: type II toxin-antitoxin system HicA family toxin [Firmicutes bacterium]|nr:type II toxin-antitoxin system HicA family toxin [Bacillota bacterium]